MKIAFFSSSPLSVSLADTLKKHFEIALVGTNPDRPIGRKAILTPSVLKNWALKNQIDVFTPHTLKNEVGTEIAQKIHENKIDLAIVIDYGLLIPSVVFNAPRHQTINIHFSLLPKYRGAYPDAFVILSGNKKTGISFVLIDEGYDTGDLIAQKEVKILPEETASQLHQRLYQETTQILPYIITHWVNDLSRNNSEQKLEQNLSYQYYSPPRKQDHSLANYTKRLERDDGFILWETLQKILKNEEVSWEQLPKLIQENVLPTDYLHFAFCIFNFYRSLTPWPGVWTKVKTEKGEKRLKILKAKLENEKLILVEVQLEGKKTVRWKDFLRNFSYLNGSS